MLAIMGLEERDRVVPLLRRAFRGSNNPGSVPNREEALVFALEIIREQGLGPSILARRTARLLEDNEVPVQLLAKRVLDLYDAVDYSSRTEVYHIARALDIPGRSSMSLEELLNEIRARGEYVPE